MQDDILAPLSGTIDLSVALPPNIQILSRESPARYAEGIRRSGAQWIWVEGFSSAGKTNFAARIAHELGWRHIELDSLVREGVNNPTYAAHMDREKLFAHLGTSTARQHKVVEGVCLRDVMDLLGNIEAATTFYIAKVTRHGTSMVWHDGFHIEDNDAGGPWLMCDTIRYHFHRRPHANADVILLRADSDS